MSTRITIADGEEFAFYQEIFDTEGRLHLELVGDGLRFDVRPGYVMVAIPRDVWEKIRVFGPKHDPDDWAEDREDG